MGFNVFYMIPNATFFMPLWKVAIKRALYTVANGRRMECIAMSRTKLKAYESFKTKAILKDEILSSIIGTTAWDPNISGLFLQ